MKSETSFIDLLQRHKQLFNDNFTPLINEMIKRIQDHDMDKIYNPTIYNIYAEHFIHLKQIPFSTQEYLDYEKKYFWDAHMLHAQNRHHFYSKKNYEVTDPNLIDLIEAIIDIYVSNLQYNDTTSVDSILDVLKTKGILDISLETYIKNTLDVIHN